MGQVTREDLQRAQRKLLLESLELIAEAPIAALRRVHEALAEATEAKDVAVLAAQVRRLSATVTQCWQRAMAAAPVPREEVIGRLVERLAAEALSPDADPRLIVEALRALTGQQEQSGDDTPWVVQLAPEKE